MTRKFLTAMASLAVLSALLSAGPAISDAPKPAYKKLSTSGATLKKRNGYWVECRYTGLGTVCDYVYATVKPKGGAPGARPEFRRIKADSRTLKKKSGYWLECRYTGLGTVCDYVYATAKKPK